MKYALIGCGRIAVNHIKAVLNNGLEMVAVCDIVPEHIDVLFSKTGYDKPVERYEDYKEMIDNHPELVLVSIATDSGKHAEIALYCIEKGINVIIEKPIAMSLADADRIIALSKEKGVIFSSPNCSSIFEKSMLLLSILAGVPVLNRRTSIPRFIRDAVNALAAGNPFGPVYLLTSP